MSLQTYQAKRRFQRTPEPKGKVLRGRGALRFVVQKHQASHLHYDFRLEAGGTLKSWAVPKGPSLNPDDKRLALMVEDHPLDYLLFEGIIPKGNYGAGTVMVWDHGTYHVPGITNRQENERLVQEGLRKGHLSIFLHGTKLRGTFTLIHTQRGQENAWLLVKKRDAFATEQHAAGRDLSILSNRTMEEIAQGKPTRKATQTASELDLSDAPKRAMPRNIRPMLATAVPQPFDHPDWIFELKWDGYRAIAEVESKRVRLYSRNQLSLEQRFAPIVDSLQHLGHEAVLDGEVVVIDPSGRADFQLLQRYQKTRQGSLTYMVFDLLYLDGHDLTSLPLLRRKEILARILADLPNVKFSDHVAEHGLAFFQAVSQRGLEGMVAKDGKSRHREGLRSRCWLKIKTHLRQEAVIGGFTEPKGSRKGLGSLVLGVYEGSDLVYIGHAGSGLTEHALADLRSRLEGLSQKTCPFKNRPKTNAPVHWVQPQLVCEVSFVEWSQDGHMRQPIFLGLRPDKEARTVRRETPLSLRSVLQEDVMKADIRRQRTHLPEGELAGPNRQVSIAGHVLHLTNLDKLYWPEDGYTKGNLIQYYRQVADFILPHLKDRPQSLNRHPNGIHGKNFFQKDVSRQPPPAWVETVLVFSESGQKDTRSLVCQDEATLVYLANLGCIELNPWSSRILTLDQPDYLVLDLDPEDIAFDRVVEAAQMVRKMLDKAEAPALCKTSGKRGLHVYVPLGARYSYDQAKQFTELIAGMVHRELPGSTSLVRSPAQRQKRVYLDFLQNGRGKTLAAAYAVRPQPGATVSTPLKWTEVKRGLDPAKFTMRTIPRRLDKWGDLWAPMLGPGIDLPTCLERLASRLKRKTLC